MGPNRQIYTYTYIYIYIYLYINPRSSSWRLSGAFWSFSELSGAFRSFRAPRKHAKTLRFRTNRELSGVFELENAAQGSKTQKSQKHGVFELGARKHSQKRGVFEPSSRTSRKHKTRKNAVFSSWALECTKMSVQKHAKTRCFRAGRSKTRKHIKTLCFRAGCSNRLPRSHGALESPRIDCSGATWRLKTLRRAVFSRPPSLKTVPRAVFSSALEPLGARIGCSGATGRSKTLRRAMFSRTPSSKTLPRALFSSVWTLESATPEPLDTRKHCAVLCPRENQENSSPPKARRLKKIQKTRAHWGHLARESSRKPRALEKTQEHRELGITVHSSQSLFEIALRNHCSR